MNPLTLAIIAWTLIFLALVAKPAWNLGRWLLGLAAALREEGEREEAGR